ncbi:uncharacterized protein FIBRA_08499 [Fibroporia radiculosa]|uniref:Polyketide synthase phosphopantetheine-binding domain-containing protein n=1 Tax=Fibroporia radiculosa TaxID=599839 RepID=J4GWX1_9APHY|nr:uncharacterized protein FIBRA_08499 [Fibroporia radiculosa]CCM06250.1 predicted protein [Fibroporia radiculosa]
MLHLPNKQGVNCPTFNPPTALLQSQSLTVIELYEWTAEHNPEHPMFTYYDGERRTTLCGPDVVRAMKRAANKIVRLVDREVNSVGGAPPVIAVLSISDTISQYCFIGGMVYAGYTVFPISPRNSPAAVAHLLSKSNACCVFVSTEPAIQNLAKAAIQDPNYEEKAFGKPPIHPIPQFSDLFPPDHASEVVKFEYPRQYGMDTPAIIVHSSGSTAFPKTITWTHRHMLEGALIPWYGEVDLAGVVMGFHSLPLFHGLGLLHICFLPSCGIILATFPPANPATMPTPQNVFDGVQGTQSELVCCVPAFIEAWSHDPSKVTYMKGMKGIIYGGGPLSREVGDRLSAEGITILPQFGISELGVLNTYLPKPGGADWEYFTFSGICKSEFISHGDGTFEVVVVSHDLLHPRIINTKVGDTDAYATNDLIQPHPTKEGYWRVYGRTDDQIMLANGEKTNPGPIEDALCRDPHVKGAVMFGRGKLHNGVIIDPKPEYAFDPSDIPRLEQFRNDVWPTIEKLNLAAPQHSRLFKEMILVVSPSKPFQYTGKGTPRRPAILSDYEAEIQSLYDSVDETMQSKIPVPSSWDLSHITEFVEKTVISVMKSPVAADDDLFQHGCDRCDPDNDISLQATWIRNTILRALRQHDPVAPNRLSPTFVFEEPSVAKLSKLIWDVVHSPDRPKETDHIKEMQRLVDEYTRGYPTRPLLLHPPSQGAVVLITGTTGGLGSDTLAHLLEDKNVERVYAFNRQSRGAASKQREAFLQRGHDMQLLQSRKYVPIEGDTSISGFGIDPQRLDEIRNTTTNIIHNAWRVDFNLSLSSFESNIKSLRHLVDLALTSPLTTPPRLLFVSSVGVLYNASIHGEAPEVPNDDPSTAVGTGYTESKWVAERILQVLSNKTELKPVVVRVGQVSGDRYGHWNEREWFPSLVKSATFQRCLPRLDGTVSWIPAYDAAKALVQMRDSPHPVLHLAHPHPVTWNSLIAPIADTLGVPLVSYGEWLAALGNSFTPGTSSEVEMLRKNPALRLLTFFRGCKVDGGKEPLGATRLATTKAVQVAPALLVPETDVQTVQTWIAAWRKSGFLPLDAKA